MCLARARGQQPGLHRSAPAISVNPWSAQHSLPSQLIRLRRSHSHSLHSKHRRLIPARQSPSPRGSQRPDMDVSSQTTHHELKRSSSNRPSTHLANSPSPQFSALLRQASKQTALAQSELAAKEAARFAALKQDQLQQAKRQLEEKKLADERRRAREERERRDRELEEKRRAELPKTRNLWQLKQERIKSGLNPDGSEDYLLAASNGRAKASGSGTSKAGAVAKVRTGTSSPRAPPRELSREEKAAAKKSKLFKEEWDDQESGSMALLRAMNGGGAGGGSGGRGASGSNSPAPRSGKTAPSTGSAAVKGKAPARSSTAPSSMGQTKGSNTTTGAGMSAKDRLKAGMGAMQALNTNKRDTRTIEEIEKDLRRKKALKVGGSSSSSSHSRPAVSVKPSSSAYASTSASTSAPKRSTSDSSLHQPSSKKTRPGVPPFKLRQDTSSKSRPPSSSRRHPSSDSDSDTDSDSEDDRHRRRRPREKDVGFDREEIWKIMGRDRNRDVARDMHSDDDSDMEVSPEQLRREEAKA